MDKDELVEQLDKLVASRSVSWLFGAGISKSAGVPLMGPLTDRVLSLAAGSPHEALLRDLRESLPTGTHIEHLLSHLADHISIAERSKGETAWVGGNETPRKTLIDAHEAILKWIADIVRWGYVPASGGVAEGIGTRDAPLITITEHVAFVRSLFRTALAGVAERRAPTKIFTTNYDTLIEDSLRAGSGNLNKSISGFSA